MTSGEQHSPRDIQCMRGEVTLLLLHRNTEQQQWKVKFQREVKYWLPDVKASVSEESLGDNVGTWGPVFETTQTAKCWRSAGVLAHWFHKCHIWRRSGSRWEPTSTMPADCQLSGNLWLFPDPSPSPSCHYLVVLLFYISKDPKMKLKKSLSFKLMRMEIRLCVCGCVSLCVYLKTALRYAD